MNNPYDYMEEYKGQTLDYKEFCELVKEPILEKMEKKRQIESLGKYLDVSTSYGKIRINGIYDDLSIIFNTKKSKFLEYFENLMIICLNQEESNMAKLTYVDMESQLYMINSQYLKAKSLKNRNTFIQDNNWRISGNKMDFDTNELNFKLKSNVNLFFTIADRIMKKVINDCLNSMEKKSLILVNKSYRIYKQVYSEYRNDFITIHKDCNEEQVNEILDIERRIMTKHKMTYKNELIYKTIDERQKYFDDIEKEVKSSEILEHYSYYGKLFLINLGKEGLKLESNKINKEFNEIMLNNNMQYKLLTSSDLKCVDEILKGQMVKDLIEK